MNDETAAPDLPHQQRQQQKQQPQNQNHDHDHDGIRNSGGSSRSSSGSHHGPAGGYDATPIPPAPPGYTLRFTIHRAHNLPLGDLGTLSSDPYVVAILDTALPQRHRQDPPLGFRTPTLRRTANPEWNCSWVVANVPASGFRMKCRVYDADSADHDDRLGSAYVEADRVDDDGWEGYTEHAFRIRQRTASVRAYVLRFVVSSLSLDNDASARGGLLVVSVECLGRTPGADGGQIYTIAPNYWRQHFSPLIGRLVGVKDSATSAKDGGGHRSVSRYNFQAIQMQLRGPVPPQMYHRYVEFRPFVRGMFNGQTLRGRLLNHALHHQHARIYNYDRTTQYGEFAAPGRDFTQQFLDFAQHDRGGRIFTYVVTLDGQWRFTETGQEFGIDLLSKHTMHSDVSIYIAYSGEFFVRRWGHDYRRHHRHHSSTGRPHSQPHHHHHNQNQNQQTPSHADANAESDKASGHRHRRSSLRAEAEESGARAGQSDRPSLSRGHDHGHDHISAPSTPLYEEEDPSTPPSTDPAAYELFIDNDSGTYRPNAALLPLLRDFLAANLPGLHITTLDCQADAGRMNALKTEQRERKREAAAGRPMAFVQHRSSSSLSLSPASSASSSLVAETGQGQDGVGAGAGAGVGVGEAPGPGAAEENNQPHGRLSLSSSDEDELDQQAGDVPADKRQRAKRAMDVKAQFRGWLERGGPKDHWHADGQDADVNEKKHKKQKKKEEEEEEKKKEGSAGLAD